MIVNSYGISPRVASVVVHLWYQSHTIISVSPARVLQLFFKKLFCSEIKLAISAALEIDQNTSGALLAALSILNSCGASPGATEKVAALVTALHTITGSHLILIFFCSFKFLNGGLLYNCILTSIDLCCCWLKILLVIRTIEYRM